MAEFAEDDKRLRLESMAFMATKAGDMPGKSPPKAKGLGRLRGNSGSGLRPFLVSMSKVNPGYKNGLMVVGSRSGVISSFSRSGGPTIVTNHLDD